MAMNYHVLGQVSPAANTLSTLYTVPAELQTTVTCLAVTNRSATATTFRVAVAVNGLPDDIKQYLFYDTAISGNSTFNLDSFLTLAAGDVVRVYAGTGNLSFNLFGMEQ